MHWPTQRTMERLDVIPSSIQRFSCILIGCILYGLVQNKYDTRQSCYFRLLNMYFFSLYFKIIFLSLILHQDTAGSERFESISTLYYRGAKAAIVCYGKTKFGQSQLSVFNCIDFCLGLNFRCASGLFTIV